MLEVIEKILYIVAFTGQTLLIIVGVRAIMSQKDRIAGTVFILGGLVGLNVLIGGTVVGFLVGPILLALCVLFFFIVETSKFKSREKRRHSRTEIAYPVVVMTPDGPVAGVTQNLSLGGAFVRCSKLPEVDDTFRLVIKPTKRPPLLVHAEMVWSGTLVSEDSMPNGMGLSFRFIANDEGHQLISNAISNHI